MTSFAPWCQRYSFFPSARETCTNEDVFLDRLYQRQQARKFNVDNSGTATGPHVVLNIGYDNMQRETSLSATVGQKG